jgi:predicted amidohydrolase YtcJ
MKYKVLSIFLFLIPFLFINCTKTSGPDLIVYNGVVYTVDSLTTEAEAFAVKDGKFIAIGTNEDIRSLATNQTELIDAQGAFIMPGLIEGHGHFAGLGQHLMNLDFLRDTSWDEIVQKVKKASEIAEPGQWIVGRGWHQEKWMVQENMTINGYPIHNKLSEAIPDHPVILFHASGHSLFANKKAMEMAGVNRETPNPQGGVIVRGANYEAIGVFEERAMSLIQTPYRQFLDTQNDAMRLQNWYKGIDLAQNLCLSYGITSFQDAGTSFEDLERYKIMAEEGKLKIKLWSMIRHDITTLMANTNKIPVINAGNGFFTCNAIKSELDGALGVFGAWKLKPYADKLGYYGQNTTKLSQLDSLADFALEKNMQLCVHAIGDRANREFLEICEAKWSKIENGKSRRWRSEHAQHLDTADIQRFPELGIIASMQGIHCTSDAPFVVRRLGIERSRTGAYAWRSLLDAGVIINNGTDAPVESLNPFECLYASISRKRIDTGEAFFPEQAMSRKEAIFSYTMANAYAAFEEQTKGSISIGKAADFILLDRNLITCEEDQIYKAKVVKTFVNGVCKYEQK